MMEIIPFTSFLVTWDRRIPSEWCFADALPESRESQTGRVIYPGSQRAVICISCAKAEIRSIHDLGRALPA
jgi:hypothetical protein